MEGLEKYPIQAINMLYGNGGVEGREWETWRVCCAGQIRGMGEGVEQCMDTSQGVEAIEEGIAQILVRAQVVTAIALTALVRGEQRHKDVDGNQWWCGGYSGRRWDGKGKLFSHNAQPRSAYREAPWKHGWGKGEQGTLVTIVIVKGRAPGKERGTKEEMRGLKKEVYALEALADRIEKMGVEGEKLTKDEREQLRLVWTTAARVSTHGMLWFALQRGEEGRARSGTGTKAKLELHEHEDGTGLSVQQEWIHPGSQ